VPSISGDAGGYMPLNRQFGFVENSGNPEHAMAHELGHGAFNLWHTFSDRDFVAAQGATDNLMDYSGGTRLYRHQWDLLHNPEAVLMPWMVDEEEVMFVHASGYAISPDFKYFINILDVNAVGNIKNIPGTLSCFNANGVIYEWDSQWDNYVAGKTQTYGGLTKIDINKGLPDTATVYLLYDLNNPCGYSMYSTIKYSELKKHINDIQEYAGNNSLQRKIIVCKGENAVSRGFEIITTDRDNTLLNFYKELKETYDKFIAFYNTCNDQQWQPGKEPGIIPKCFWKNSQLNEKYHYTLFDLAFLSGIIDGGYAEFDGIMELINLLMSGKIEEKIKDIAYAYTVAYLECSNIEINTEQYKQLINKLAEVQTQETVWSWIQEQVYTPQVKSLEAKFERCDSAQQLRQDISNALTELKESIDSFEEIKNIINNIGSKFSDYCNLITNSDNAGRYEAGRLVVPVISIAIPVVGQAGKVTKIGKAKNILKGVTELSETQAKKLTDDLIAQGEKAGIIRGAGSYVENLARYGQLFREGKYTELFAELKKTTAFPKMGRTRVRNISDLEAEYRLNQQINPGDPIPNFPYSRTNPITDFELAETGYFVRVYSNRMDSEWIFRIEDLRTYKNVDELVEKLALPGRPTEIAIVEVPAGTTIRKSIVGAQNWGNGVNRLGGGIQYEIKSGFKEEWFRPLYNDINEFFK
ncbi:MAG: hypothetical protein LBV26_01375, partial [Bacteroidales bacterium]|nr:hypothetical protein [Bacteroidales bacterium]